MIAHTSVAQHALLAVAGVLAVAAYAGLWSRRRRTGVVEPVMWAIGIGVMLAATSSPFERAADDSFTWHMAQHLVLGLIATPFLVLARPGRLIAESWPAVRRHGRDLHPGAAGPVIGASIAVVLMFAVHAGPVYDLALRHQFVHDLQHVLFVVAGVLFWVGALGARARQGPARLVAALTAATGLTLLSVWILTLDTPLSDQYVDRRGYDSALRDQRMGAGLMWVGMIAVTMPLLMLAVWRWAAAEQRQAERREQLQQPGVRHHSVVSDTEISVPQRASRS